MCRSPLAFRADDTRNVPATVAHFFPDFALSMIFPMTATDELILPETTSQTIYNRVFWLSYFANFSLVTANALLFRFAEFVKFLGGTEQATGTIVSAGLIATLLVRFRLGQDIDRFGTRRLWIASGVLFLVSCGLFLVSDSIGWEVYLGRAVFSVAIAGMFTCTMVFIQNHVPADRRTEAIGNLGSGGFLAMIAGALLGDWILSAFPAGRTQFHVLFGTAAALGASCLVTVVILTRQDAFERIDRSPPLHRLLIRYWPGSVVLAVMMIGVNLSVTTVFLTRFVTERRLGGLGLFFMSYALSAFVFRLRAQHWSHTVGRHRMILMGLAGHLLGNLLLTQVAAAWQLLIPSACCGFGHALLFPAAVSLGAGKFPRSYRGTGTNVMIGASELGIALSSPVLGWVIDHYGYNIMFCVAAFTTLVIALIYALTSAKHPDREGAHEDFTHIEEEFTADANTDEGDEDAVAPFPHIGRTG